MPAVIPPKPVAGAMVDAAWGGDMHDRMYNPKGIVATGVNTTVAQGTNVLVDLSGTNSGNSAWHAGNVKELTCPVGHSGWYHCELFMQVVAGPAQGTPMRARILRDGGVMVAGGAPVISATGTTYLTVCGTFLIADGDVLTVDAFCPVAMTVSIPRFSVLRAMNAVAST